MERLLLFGLFGIVAFGVARVLDLRRRGDSPKFFAQSNRFCSHQVLAAIALAGVVMTAAAKSLGVAGASGVLASSTYAAIVASSAFAVARLVREGRSGSRSGVASEDDDFACQLPDQPVTRLSTWAARLPMALSGLLPFVPLLWFSGERIISTGDYNPPLNPGRMIGNILQGWSPDNLGQPTVRSATQLFPYLAFWRAGEAVGLPTATVQRGWFVALHAMAVVAVWFLVSELLPRGPRFRWVGFAAAAIYLFNPFTLYSWSVGHNVLYLAYAAAPMWFVLILRLVRRERTALGGIAAAFASLLFGSAFANPAMIATMIILPTALACATAIATRSSTIWRCTSSLLLATPWILLFQAWWLLPAARALVAGEHYSYAGMSSPIGNWPTLTTPVPFVDFLRGMGFWGFYSQYKGIPFFSWARSFDAPVIVLVTLGFAALAVTPLLRRRPTIWRVTISSLFVASVFLSKGVNSPAGGLNLWLFHNVPGMYLFRGTYEKFGGPTFFALLLATLLLGSAAGRSRVQTALFVSMMSLAAALSSWPLFTGDVTRSRSPYGVKMRVAIPAYYETFRSWSATTPYGAALVAPQPAGTGYMKTTWGFAGVDPLFHFSSLPLLSGEPEARPGDGPRYRALLDALEHFDDQERLQLLGIKYVVVRHDLDPHYYGLLVSPAEAEERLRMRGFRLLKDIGGFRIYGVPGNATYITTISAESAAVQALPGAALGFTEYGGRIRGAGSIKILFPQAFSPDWQLSMNPTNTTVDHGATADGLNSWTVHAMDGSSFRIHYGAQRWAQAGIAISLFSMVAAGLLVVLRRVGGFRSANARAQKEYASENSVQLSRGE